MSKKTVKVNITSHALSREESGVVFEVRSGGGKFGELVVSKGGIRWTPRNKQKDVHLSWERLDKVARKDD